MNKMKRENGLLKKVRTFFGEHLISVKADFFGKLASVSIVYRDFIPANDVYAWASRSIPYLWSLQVERVYSDTVYHQVPVLEDLDEVNQQIHYEEWLYDKTFD